MAKALVELEFSRP